MTPKQYSDAIGKAGLSQRSAAKVLGVDERTSRKWIAGDSRIPESAAILLRLLVAGKITAKDIEAAHDR